ncbi:hypothetical protein BVER_00105c [Candidatus Burkholderia verschuerenii]|uniref:Uncharacterized protein n=1 Tax=Candidatus Burkholderia verschuerenii TaxID=242163 RepID=A0A0L0MCZ1_9BURK|nr:class I SAM-dependent methyltransferase [Candidatus Burkholderia verschuerenii]KND60125.1 hypothetical protein BVER_00105c [Candidatus Burkholderia verschuerenii]
MTEPSDTDRYKHFDSDYYEDGAKKGTVYRDYRAETRRNRTYFEIVETIIECFQPKRVLEIGCATGIVVKHLNDLGVEAHGIDVSSWSVDNREHENVILSGAESLPYPDDYFDVVFSVHSLEHLPSDVKDAAFAEMTRVCGSGIQFHMLPILGAGPYCGDTFGHLISLRSDPTHNLLFNRDWWLREWGRQGWHDTWLQIAFLHDGQHFELTKCQYILSRSLTIGDLYKRVLRHDTQVARGLHSTLHGKPPPGLDIHLKRLSDTFVHSDAASAENPGTSWHDIAKSGDGPTDVIQRLQQEARAARQEAEHYKKAYVETIHSTCWKITAPLRWLKTRGRSGGG